MLYICMFAVYALYVASIHIRLEGNLCAALLENEGAA
jgi:hypothetical protein